MANLTAFYPSLFPNIKRKKNSLNMKSQFPKLIIPSQTPNELICD